jgi:aspartate/methionine/tyrosine aminotransferase
MRRRDKISPFIVMDILREAKKRDDVIHLEIGEPDLDPPPKVIELLKRGIDERRYFYTPALGLPELRERIALYYEEKYGVSISPERVVITTGTSGAFLVAYSILLEQGDPIALADPSYPCYKNFAHLLCTEPVFIKVFPENNYQIRPEDLKGTSVKAVHLSSPANPTGTLYDAENLRSLADWCEEAGVSLISDEIYHGLVYEGRERTALEFSDRAVVISGFSKYFCMPGFRIGWMILPEDLVRDAEKVIQNVFISAPTLSQYCALGAFDYEYLAKVRETFLERRNVLYEGLKDVFEIEAEPQGAFYLWARIDEYSRDSYEFSMRLLREAGVAVTPGVDFGKNDTDRFIRLAYTREVSELERAVERIRNYLRV